MSLFVSYHPRLNFQKKTLFTIPDCYTWRNCFFTFLFPSITMLWMTCHSCSFTLLREDKHCYHICKGRSMACTLFWFISMVWWFLKMVLLQLKNDTVDKRFGCDLILIQLEWIVLLTNHRAQHQDMKKPYALVLAICTSWGHLAKTNHLAQLMLRSNG